MTYPKTTWNTGDTIAKEKLNNIENELELLDGLTGTLQTILTVQSNVTANDVVEYINGGIKKKVTCSSVGTEVAVNAETVTNVVAVYISEEKVMVLYDETSTIYAVILTVSGNAITVGTPLSVVTDMEKGAARLRACLIDTDKALCLYKQITTGKLTAIVLTVDGTTISKGSAVASELDCSTYFKACKTATDTALVLYNDGTNQDAVMVTVSSTTPTFNTPLDNYYTTASTVQDVILIDTNKCVGIVRNTSGLILIAHVFSISGTTITAGSPLAIQSATSTLSSLVKIDTNKFFVGFVYNDSGENFIKVYYCTVSGTTITIKQKNNLQDRLSSSTNTISIVKVTDNRYALCIASATIFASNVITFDFTGNNIRRIKEQFFGSTGTASSFVTLIYIGKDKSIAVFKGTSTYARAQVIPTQYYKNVIGITTETKSAGQTASVVTKGEITGLSSLTDGTMYYLQDDGSIGSTPTEFKLGVALSDTTLQLDPYSVL